MDDAPSKEHLNELVNSLCELQGRILSVVGPPKHYQQSLAASVEPLKTPIYVLRQLLGYADFPQSRVQPRSTSASRPSLYHSSSTLWPRTSSSRSSLRQKSSSSPPRAMTTSGTSTPKSIRSRVWLDSTSAWPTTSISSMLPNWRSS